MRFEVKTGATRHAVIIGSLVFKIPALFAWKVFLQGLLSNMQETFLRSANEKFCPTKLSVPGGFLNVQPYARPLTDLEWELLTPEAFDLYRRGSRGKFLPVEYKRESLGYLGDKLVFVDYGG